jgi:O-antigen/teichoic acid export membrane protein
MALGLTRPATWLSTLGLTILLPRYLGDVSLGRMNAAFAFADWCGLVASLGVSTYLTKEVARSRSQAASVVLNALSVRLIVGVLVGIGAVLLAGIIDLSGSTRTLVYLLTVHMLLLVLAGVFIGALQGVQSLKAVALIDSGSKLIQLGLVAAVLLAGYGVIGVAVAYTLSDVILILGLLAAVRRDVGLAGPVRLRACLTIVRGGVPFLVWETALLTYARVDVLILAMFAHEAVLGWYAAAYRIVSIPLFIPTVLMTAVFPALSATADEQVAFRQLTRRSVQVAGLTTVPMALGLMMVSGALIRFFGYPPPFVNSVWPTALLASTLPFVGINMILGSALAASDKQRAWAFAGVVAAVLNVGLNFAAIPYTQHQFGNGAIGAAAVTSLTEVWLLCAGFALLPAGVIDRPTVLVLLRSAAAGAVMVALLWPVHDWTVLLTIPLGASVYGLAIFAFRAVSLSDVRQLRQQLRPA